jgi:diguanylate cyclase (GGDEF)-like protein
MDARDRDRRSRTDVQGRGASRENSRGPAPAADELRQRDPMLEAIKFTVESFLSSASWRESLPVALASLGEANRASRAYVFEAIRDMDGTWLCHQVCEWAAPGVLDENGRASTDVFALRENGFGRWENELGRGRPIYGPVSGFPPAERIPLEELNVKSVAVAPVFIGASWWGFIGLDDCWNERSWTPAEMDALKVTAGILGAVIQRQQTEEMVSRLYETERAQRQVAQSLREVSSNFSSTLSFDGLLDQILDELPRIVPYDAAYLMLVTPGFSSEPLGALAAGAGPVVLGGTGPLGAGSPAVLGGTGPLGAGSPAAFNGIEQHPAVLGGTAGDSAAPKQKVVVARQRGYDDRTDGRQPWFPGQTFDLLETPALRWMAEQRQPLVVSDTRSASGLLRLDVKGRYGSWAAAPIVMQGQVVAFFALEKIEVGFYRAEHAGLLGLYASQAGLALQNARLFTEALAALEREGNLNQVTWAISSNLDLPTILQNVVRLATELAQADAGALAILSLDGQELDYPFLFNLPASLANASDPRGRGLAWNVIDGRKSHLLPDYSQFPSASPAWIEAGVHAVVSVPLVAGDTCVGCLGLFSYNPEKRFSQRDLALMESVGRQAGIAIQNARLFEAAERRAREAETLRLAMGEVTSALEFDRVLSKILKHLRNVVPYDSAVVFLTEGEAVRAVAGSGLSTRNQVINHTFPGNNALFSEIRRGRSRPLIIQDAQVDPRFERWGNATHTHGWMGLPLRARGELIGFLTVDSKQVGAYHPQDAALVQAFADEVAIAISNASLFRQVQHLAITDPLTNLHNRRYFFEAGHMELDRARRYQRPMALIMLDIDHFKLVNDTYGHQAGDRVLATVAARCLEKLRSIDISARYGGEEFVFLLPETDMERAVQVAGRLRAVLMDEPIDVGEHQISISVSLGLAEMSEDCHDLQMLIRRADQALYVTKDTGRGRITAWTEGMGGRR